VEFPVAKTPLEDHPGHWKFTFKLITNDLCLQCFDTVGWAAGLGHPACKNGGWWRWALVSSDGVAPSQMVGVSDSVYLSLYHKVQKFSSGTGSPGWSRNKGCKTVVVWWWLIT